MNYLEANIDQRIQVGFTCVKLGFELFETAHELGELQCNGI